MSAHDDVIDAFYSAFSRRDYRAMAECYHRDVEFRDPVFTLEGGRARAMWHMLCERGADLRIEWDGVESRGDAGSAHWQAWYTFSQTGRKVHNDIRASFEFADGKIRRHVDSFDFWRWSRQALGAPGLLLGWSPPLRAKVRATAGAALAKFVEEHPEYA